MNGVHIVDGGRAVVPYCSLSRLSRGLGPGVEDGGEQLADDVVAVLVAGGADVADLGLGVGAGLVLGRLVAGAVLRLERLELRLLLRLVRVDLLLGLVARLAYALRAVLAGC